MPTLKEYVPSSPKSGYYILANVGATSPVTLQTTALGSRILSAVGYKPDQAVPTRLVWAMYDVGLLNTSRSRSNIDKQLPDDTGQVLSELGLDSILRATERERLLRILDNYNGPNTGQIASLRERLKTSTSLGTRPSSSRDDGTVYPSSEGEAVCNLYVWTDGVHDYRTQKRKFEQHPFSNLASMQTFYQHPFVDFSSVSFQYNGHVKYPLRGTGLDCKMVLTDKRGSEYTDYLIEFEFDDGATGNLSVLNREIDTTSGLNGRFGDSRLGDIVELLLPTVEEEVRREDLVTNQPESDNIPTTDGEEIPVVDGVSEYRTTIAESESSEYIEVVVVRISNQGNPVAMFPGNREEILTDGSPGNIFVVKKTGGSPYRPLAIIS